MLRYGFAALVVACAGCSTSVDSDTAGTSDSAEPQSTEEALLLGGRPTGALRAAVRAELRDDESFVALTSVCPRSREDALCVAARDAEAAAPDAAVQAYTAVWRETRSAFAARGAAAVEDPAVRWAVRERVSSLHGWNVVTELGARAVDVPEYTSRARALFETWFPLYDAASVRVAQTPVPPQASETCAEPKAILLVYPGVVRLQGERELEGHMEAVRRAVRCLRTERLPTGTFLSLEENARLAAERIHALDTEIGKRLPLHMVGYSQGVPNALRTLALDDGIAARTRSVLALNSSAHGSEAIDAVADALRLRERLVGARCDELSHETSRAACTRQTKGASAPVLAFAKAALTSLGVDAEAWDPFGVRAWLEERARGILSLTTEGTEAFWAEHGARLPRHTVYLSWRSVITDETKNLPLSNKISYDTIWNAAPASPYNDMQMRLARHPLGGPLADREILFRVAEGNHWQWALTARDVPAPIMPPWMFAGVPRYELIAAYYQALAELGLLA